MIFQVIGAIGKYIKNVKSHKSLMYTLYKSKYDNFTRNKPETSFQTMNASKAILNNFKIYQTTRTILNNYRQLQTILNNIERFQTALNIF